MENETLNTQLSLLRNYLSDLKLLREKFTLEELQKDRLKQYQLLHPLLLAIQSCIDIGNHLIAELDLERPSDYAGIFKILFKKGIISKELLGRLDEMVKFRNRLVHVYGNIDIETVYRIVKEDLSDFEKFEYEIVKYIER